MFRFIIFFFFFSSRRRHTRFSRDWSSDVCSSDLSGASRTVTVTPAANQIGTATITVTVSDGTLTANDTFNVNVTATALQTWRLQYFGVADNIGNAADLSDPDKDGLSNVLEFALN